MVLKQLDIQIKKVKKNEILIYILYPVQKLSQNVSDLNVKHKTKIF